MIPVAIVRWSARVALCCVLALALVRVSFATDIGMRVLDVVPNAFWGAYHWTIGLGASGKVETLQDADAALVFCVGAIAALALMTVVERVIRRRTETR